MSRGQDRVTSDQSSPAKPTLGMFKSVYSDLCVVWKSLWISLSASNDAGRQVSVLRFGSGSTGRRGAQGELDSQEESKTKCREEASRRRRNNLRTIFWQILYFVCSGDICFPIKCIRRMRAALVESEASSAFSSCRGSIASTTKDDESSSHSKRRVEYGVE